MNSIVFSYSVLAGLSLLAWLVMFAQWRPVAAKVSWPNYLAVTFQLFVVIIAFLFYFSLVFPLHPSLFVNVNEREAIASLEWRYLKWALTTPLSVTAFFFLLWGYYPAVNVLALVLRVGVMMLIALAFGYVSESLLIAEGASLVTWSTFLIGVALLLIIYLDVGFFIQRASHNLKTNYLLSEKKHLLIFFLWLAFYIIVLGWTIYPIGYLMSLLGAEWLVLRELFYVYADILNKLLFAFIVMRIVLFLSDVKKLA
jgi:hypothetical protein